MKTQEKTTAVTTKEFSRVVEISTLPDERISIIIDECHFHALHQSLKDFEELAMELTTNTTLYMNEAFSKSIKKNSQTEGFIDAWGFYSRLTLALKASDFFRPSKHGNG